MLLYVVVQHDEAAAAYSCETDAMAPSAQLPGSIVSRVRLNACLEFDNASLNGFESFESSAPPLTL